MVKGENTLEAGTPASFDVLTNEIRGLRLEHANWRAEGFSQKRTVCLVTARSRGFGQRRSWARRFTPHRRYNVHGTLAAMA